MNAITHIFASGGADLASEHLVLAIVTIEDPISISLRIRDLHDNLSRRGLTPTPPVAESGNRWFRFSSQDRGPRMEVIRLICDLPFTCDITFAARRDLSAADQEGWHRRMCQPILETYVNDDANSELRLYIADECRVDEDSFDQVAMSLSRIGKRWSRPALFERCRIETSGETHPCMVIADYLVSVFQESIDMRPRLVDAMSVDRGRLMRRLRVISDSGRGVHYTQETFRKQFLIPLPTPDR